MAKIFFVSAGPGDPDLITIKGRRLLDEADVVIYAGSLINPELLKGLQAALYDSSALTLEEIIEIMQRSVSEDKIVVRLHSGDTSFYSAISEQIQRLRELNLDYEVVPGVSSAVAGAAILGQELTIPEISQTVIFTRIEGRTPVPQQERLSSLAKHNATMVIFLSIGMVEEVYEELKQGYPEDTPFVVIEKATWPDQRIIRGRLKDLVALVKSANIKRTALIYIGKSLLASEMNLQKKSKLYDKSFKHSYRN